MLRFERAIQIAPDRDDLRFQVAWMAERQGRLDEAESMYSKLVEKNPALENAWFRLGYLQLQRGNNAGSHRRL